MWHCCSLASLQTGIFCLALPLQHRRMHPRTAPCTQPSLQPVAEIQGTCHTLGIMCNSNWFSIQRMKNVPVVIGSHIKLPTAPHALDLTASSISGGRILTCTTRASSSHMSHTVSRCVTCPPVGRWFLRSNLTGGESGSRFNQDWSPTWPEWPQHPHRL